MSISLPSGGRIDPGAAQLAAQIARENAIRASIYAASGQQRLAALVAERAATARILDSAAANQYAVFRAAVANIWAAEARHADPRTVITDAGPVSAAALAALRRHGGALAATLAAVRARLADLDEQITRARAASTDADATTTLRLVTA